MIEFLQGPLVAPLYGLLVVATLGALLGMYRAYQQGTFDWKKVPGILDTTVLRKVVPLAILGIAHASVGAGTAEVGLLAAYSGATVAAYSAEIAALIEKATGSFVATTKAQDSGTAGIVPVAS